jgi:integrase
VTVLTSDNTHLSEPREGEVGQSESLPFEVNCKLPSERSPVPIDEQVQEFLNASRSANTLRAYRSDLADFLGTGGTFPAEPIVVARYLAQRAEELASATLRRRLVAIAQAHTNRGLPNPCKSDIVRLTLRGIRRVHGRPQSQAWPLMKSQLEVIVRALGCSFRDRRDKAILTVGFYSAVRRSELVDIRVESLLWREDGLMLTISKSKTDQESRGRHILMQKRSAADCPAEALRDWLGASEIGSGPIFRSIEQRGRIGERAVSPELVNAILKRRLEAAGFASQGFSGHSLRAGFVTEAVNAGWPLCKIREQTGHASDATLERYIRRDQINRELFTSI